MFGLCETTLHPSILFLCCMLVRLQMEMFHSSNIFTQANEPSPITHYYFVHSQQLTHGMRCKQTGGGVGVRGQGSGLRRISAKSHFQTSFLSAVIALVCGHFAIRRPPVCICLTASGEPGPSGALFIRELSPAGSPHRCCALTWGHPPTLCCVNDSPPHLTVKKKEEEQRADCYRVISGDCAVLKESLPLKLFISAQQSRWIKQGSVVAAWKIDEARETILSYYRQRYYRGWKQSNAVAAVAREHMLKIHRHVQSILGNAFKTRSDAVNTRC